MSNQSEPLGAPQIDPTAKLWTTNFFIIIFGSVVALLGSAVAGFGIGVMALDMTGSTFFYTLVLVANKAPKMIMPLLAGPYLDRFSRKKAMVAMHLLSSAIYLGMFALLAAGFYSYWLFVVLTFIAGSVNGVYLVAHESLYPTLVARQFYRKAYAVSSVLDTLQMVAAPMALALYEATATVGPIFAVGAGAFAVAGLLATRIRSNEAHMSAQPQAASEKSGFSLKRYMEDFKLGVTYIRGEPGLMALTLYFFFNIMAMGVDALAMPYFQATPWLGSAAYSSVMIGMAIGRMCGSLSQFIFKFSQNKKFNIALFVYISVAFIQCSYLFLPRSWMMVAAMSVFGCLAGISFNIRVTSTQAYIPDSHRGRFNGVFIMMTNMGQVIGQLVAGALAEIFPIRSVYVGALCVQMLAVYFTIGRQRGHVSKIYNADL